MKQIEFRIWDKELKEMNYLSLEDLCEDDYWYDGETSVWSVLHDCNNENERFVINQYTGLTDKNGKKIFEGDILTSDEYPFKDDGEDNYIGIVYFYDNVPGFEYELRCINPKKKGISNGITNNFEPNDNLQVELEVIGNIFDEKE